MNTKSLKAYAPKARKQFIEAVKKRAAHFGIYEDRVEDVRIEGGAAIIEGRAFTRKEGEQRKRLESKLAERGYDMFTREIAYTWFNRLAALRYMEIHDYFVHGFRVLSHPTNQGGLPEILNHASDVAESLNLDKDHIIELQLAGDKEEELYRELLLGQCHQLAKIMPQIFKGLAFEAIDDATELLLPNNLTKTDSILKGLINDIPEEDWQEIEVIGWLYQFYISEHKDSVMGKVVKSEDIPAATQLFTPNWIVKYLVQNSVGRQWLATYPDSDLKDKMEYYIEPAEQSDEVIEQLKAITPTSIDPEEIKVLDPACGSGHILVEVYEVLREIYLERGYRLREIPELILTKNIYGLDIDDRAAQLAGFALMMKAREDDRRIFQRVEDGEVSLNVFSLQSTEHLDIPKLWKALDLESNQRTGSTGSLFDTSEEFVQPVGVYQEYFELLKKLKSAFIQAKTFGSLIHIEYQYLDSLINLKVKLKEVILNSDPASKQAAIEILPIINQAVCLAHRYDALIANPPYMGSGGMNSCLKDFSKKSFKNSKSDLFAIFMERAFGLLNETGLNAQVNMQAWMFISRFEKFRKQILTDHSILTLAHLGARAFGQISGEVVQTTAWIISAKKLNGFTPSFLRLLDGGESDKRDALLLQKNKYQNVSQDLFNLIPGSPLAYWVEPDVFDCFSNLPQMKEFFEPREGLATGSNEIYVRYWFEVNHSKILRGSESREDAKEQRDKKWFPYNKGGEKRRWYGNDYFVVDWENDGSVLQTRKDPSGKRIWAHNFNLDYIFRPMVSWSDITSKGLSARFFDKGYLFDATGLSAFEACNDVNKIKKALAICNSKVGNLFANLLNPTLHFKSGDFARMAFSTELPADTVLLVDKAICIAKADFDSFEDSFRFQKQPLVYGSYIKLKDCYENYLQDSEQMTEALQQLEHTLNVYCAESYGLNIETDDIEPCTLFRNYKGRFSKESEPELIFRSQTLAQLISYAIGCMMGRYSIDRNGLVHAQSNNEAFKELETEGAYDSFPADDDGIIPLASEEWLFDDDATTRFKEFVKTVWGGEHLPENVEFVAESLCLHALKPKKGESAMDTVRRYFSTQFFKDHCKTYKKRPIYWLFSSGNEKAFECLVYLHRYNEGTLSRMRTEYVTPLMGKYDAQHTLLSEQQLQATGTEARGIEKELKLLEKKQAELRTFDEQLKHYAEMRITLDLDDGVKANYGKFGNLLADVKAIHGKAVK